MSTIEQIVAEKKLLIAEENFTDARYTKDKSLITKQLIGQVYSDTCFAVIDLETKQCWLFLENNDGWEQLKLL